MKRLLISLLLVSASTGLMAQEYSKTVNPVLAHSGSPYLAMHASDPVHWHLWNAHTLALAKAQKKLLFVTSGYFACRWCHVMQHQTFQNANVAALLNRDYIPVLVDRELMPALDAKLMDFVEHTQGAGGWPLNVFITPAGYPLIGMVYVPAKKFQHVLVKLQQQWEQNRRGLMNLARSASLELSSVVVTKSSKLPVGLAASLQQAFLKAATVNEDDMQGGFGQQNKFPAIPQLDALLAVYEQQPKIQLKQFLQLTLNQMASLGLRDQLDGGFFRYCVGPGWRIPHFEKMLYTNALIARLYLHAGKVFHDTYYTRVGQVALDFMMRSMRDQDGAYIASLSAVDAQGVDGGYYLWRKQTIKSLLDADQWAVASRIWHLQGTPEFADGFLLRQAMPVTAVAKQLHINVSEVTHRLASAREKLLCTRAKRKLPRDGKRLAGWNGLVLSALVTGVRLTHNERDRRAAQVLHDYLYHVLWDGRRLLRAKARGGKSTPGTLQDYAYVIAGVMDWWQLTRDPQDTVWLRQLIAGAWHRFYGQQSWRLAQHMLLKYGASKTLVSDGAMPSPSAVLIGSTYHYAQITHRHKLRQQVLRALNVGRDEIENDPFWYATQIMVLQHIKR